MLELVVDVDVLLEVEDRHLQERKPAYNQRRIASNNRGVRYSAESCALIRRLVSESWQGDDARREATRAKALETWADPVIREARLKGVTGRVVSDEMKAKLRAANLGKKASKETRAKMRAQRAGVPQGPHSAETRKRIGDAQRGRPRGWTYSDESRAKLSASLKGKPKSPEHIAKMKATRARQRLEKLLEMQPMLLSLE